MKLVKIDEADSTNNYATRHLQAEKLPEGTVVLTFRQSNGRGQGKNRWESADYKNLTFSLILRPEFLAASSQFNLSMVISLGLHDYLTTQTDNVFIKWPNDMLISNRKVAGILIENSVLGSHLCWSVAGIGLNLNQESFGSYSPGAVSLMQITGSAYNIEDVLAHVYGHIMRRYEQLKSGAADIICREYLQRLYRMGEWGFYRNNTETFKARITGVDEFGRLALELENGEKTLWSFKEVEMLNI